jgi:hypothetical protein
MASKRRYNDLPRTQYQAYRGYSLVWNGFQGLWIISKDNHHICYARSVEDAKQQIDLIA